MDKDLAKQLAKICKSRDKADFIERVAKHLETADKAFAILVEDGEGESCNIKYTSFGINHAYEAIGILEVAQQETMLPDDEEAD